MSTPAFFLRKTRLALSAALALTASLAAHAQPEQYLKSYSVSSHPSVHVRATFGFVHVTTSNGTEVQFDVKYDKADWAEKLEINSSQEGNTVALKALVAEHSWWSWGHFGNRRLDIEVRMPRNADLKIETSNGAVDVSTVDGEVSIHTSNGRVNAEHLSGTIDIGSSNGGITLNDMHGSVKAYTSNGVIKATGLEGRCWMATSNGGVNVDGRFESLDIATGNGSVVARAEPGSKISSGWNIRTSNAGVTLSVPKDLVATLDAGTSNGGISMDLPLTVQGAISNTRIRGALNGGGPEVSIRTSNASIRVNSL
jgi:hypothetical protein